MRRRTIASTLGAAVLLAACGPGSNSTPPSAGASVGPSVSASPSGTPAPASAPASPTDTQGEVQQALAFQAPLLDGTVFDGAVTGDVVLWFWAPW